MQKEKNNERENKKTIEKTNKTKSLFFEKINEIDKPLAELIKKKEKRLTLLKLGMKEETLILTLQI